MYKVFTAVQKCELVELSIQIDQVHDALWAENMKYATRG